MLNLEDVKAGWKRSPRKTAVVLLRWERAVITEHLLQFFVEGICEKLADAVARAFLFLFLNMVFLCSSGWLSCPASTSQVLGLQVCITTSGFYRLFVVAC
jgi:hypothetical protein